MPLGENGTLEVPVKFGPIVVAAVVDQELFDVTMSHELVKRSVVFDVFVLEHLDKAILDKLDKLLMFDFLLLAVDSGLEVVD